MFKHVAPMVIFSLFSLNTLASPILHGPSQYLSFDDSPFLNNTLTYFHLEDFEDGLLNVPGVSASAGRVVAPSTFTDSVDLDDGLLDGSGRSGYSFFSDNGITGITFTFDATTLGFLPTVAGLVWTDGAPFANIFFEAFDAANNSLGTLSANSAGDSNFSGGTAEDLFFGITSDVGIASIFINNPSSGNRIEIDHLQFGGGNAEIPTLSTIWLMSFALFGLVRRKKYL